jgi:FkbM family methyltransferase
VDEGLFDLARELVKPGERVWDIGANVGLFTFAAAHLAGPKGSVLAVEADAWLAALLRQTESLEAGAAPVAVLCAAVSDADGFADFAIATRGRSTNHLTAVAGSTQTGGSRAVHPVATARLDTLLERFGPPTLVKIDVEGAEAICLRGADALLDRARPRLVCEVSAEHAEEVTALLKRHHYQIYDAAEEPSRRRAVDPAPWATLALPPALRRGPE